MAVIAKRIFYHKEQLSNGNVVEMVIWKVPATPERAHGLKYRLHYGSPKGICYVRYDNEKGKGNHKHIDNREGPYHFENIEMLIEDFLSDVAAHNREQTQ